MSLKWPKKTAILLKIFLSILLISGGQLFFCQSEKPGSGLKCMIRIEENVLFPCLIVEAVLLAAIFLDNERNRTLMTLRRGGYLSPINNDVEMNNIGAPAPQDGSQDQVNFNFDITFFLHSTVYLESFIIDTSYYLHFSLHQSSQLQH